MNNEDINYSRIVLDAQVFFAVNNRHPIIVLGREYWIKSLHKFAPIKDGYMLSEDLTNIFGYDCKEGNFDEGYRFE